MTRDPWDEPHQPGLVLRTWQPPATPARLTACVILRASDVDQLLEHGVSWAPACERILVVLGAWTGGEKPKEVERAARILREHWGARLELVLPPPAGWPDQIAKRSAYFARCRPGEVAFVVDADEELAEGPQALRAEANAAFDVGWVTIAARPRYDRPYGQPRLFRIPDGGLVYRERHYWIWRGPDLVATHTYGGAGWHHERLALTLENRGGRRRAAHHAQYLAERQAVHSPLDEERESREALRILQLGRYDPGLAAYRLHSAINATTREHSFLATNQGDNPFAGPWQYDLRDRPLLRQLASGADVLHCHLDYRCLDGIVGTRVETPIVIHHHGTVYRTDPELWNKLDQRAVLRLASTMDLLRRDVTKTLQWLPNPVPVRLYAAMAAAARPLHLRQETWIAHSPSKPKLKGTGELLASVERLRKKGLKLRVDLITDVPHREALWRKAGCDLCFDSFWLGLQVSGLEAAAMGMPVIAGDPETAAEYQRRLGEVPYTFASPETLDDVLERLVVDTIFQQCERMRVQQYVFDYHDEAAVARRYLELLRPALGPSRGAGRAALIRAEAEERKRLAAQIRTPVQATPLGVNWRLGRGRPL